MLSVTVADILAFNDRVSIFFDQCNNAVGMNNGGQTIHNDTKEIQHKLDLALLELEKAKEEKEKNEIEIKYWREKTVK